MEEALRLAREAPEPTSPNPTVGAVVVGPGGQVLGRGVTQPPPGPHAEVIALREAGERARGAVMYVTLEPCVHYGRTPPCTEAIIAAGIAEVHYALDDPDPNVQGRGRKALQAAGLRVVSGEGAEEARRILEAYLKHRTQGMPFVIAKFAASLDGRIAAASGDSRWVAGEEAREWAHQVRRRIDAIIVGSSTVLIDDPLLTARPGGREAERQPLRVVVDTRGRTPPMARVFTGPARTIVATAPDAPPSWLAAIEARGAGILTLPREGAHVSLPSLLQELARRDVVTALVEGGGVLLGSFFDRGLVDKVHAVLAPIIIGAADAPAAVAGKGAYRMTDALQLRDVEVARLGQDILITAYPVYHRGPE